MNPRTDRTYGIVTIKMVSEVVELREVGSIHLQCPLNLNFIASSFILILTLASLMM